MGLRFGETSAENRATLDAWLEETRPEIGLTRAVYQIILAEPRAGAGGVPGP